jgi:uncharacterized protein
MATLTAPGVYVEEIASGSRPIPLAGTSTAAFFGEAERGPLDRVEKVFNFSQFEERFGGFLTGGRFLAHSVYQFFRNGGGACYVGRVAREGAAAAASVTVLDRGGAQAQPTLTFRASSPGAWGNELRVVVSSAASADPANQFNLALYRDAEGGGAPDLLATYANLSMDPDDARYVVDYVAANSTVLEVVDEDSTNVINGYSESGLITVEGSDLLGAAHRQFQIDINDDGVQTVDLTADITAETPNLADPAAVAASIQRVIRTLVPLRGSTDPDSYTQATVTFAPAGAGPNGVFRITAGGAASAASRVAVTNGVDPATNAAGLLSLGAQNGGAEVHGSANQRPQVTPGGGFYLLGDDTVAGAVSAVTPGVDAPTPQAQDYVNALSRLDTVRDVSLIAVPGIGDGAVVDAGMAYCASRPLSDCFFIGDMDAADDTYVEAIAFRDALNTPNSYGAVYFPWILALDPSGVSEEPIALPPSGFIAGLYGRIDGRRGVWKAPAGTEALLNGARGLTATLTDGEHGDLNNNPASVCVIRRVPGTGVVAWGARTVSSDPEYTYIPVRRTAIFLRVSIYNGIQWAVFEPNDEPLWASLRLNIGSFMNLLFRRGAFQGSKPSDAYFVKCDAETTTQADIDLGIVNVLVGFAPLKPAEFVVVKIRQIAGQSS